MARLSTTRRVHAAVLRLAGADGPDSLTMEGIAAEAGVGKQTLYRSWPGITALIFDALLAESAAQADGAGQPPGGVVDALVELLDETAREMSTPPREVLLRWLAGRIQTDEDAAAQYRTRLLEPQRETVHAFLRGRGVDDVERVAEALLAPVFYRWFMRDAPMTRDELLALVERTLADQRS